MHLPAASHWCDKARGGGNAAHAPADTEPWPLERVAAIVKELDNLPVTEAITVGPEWPSVDWERDLLQKLNHPFFPRLAESFVDGTHEYLVEEPAAGRLLWDAWDDPTSTDRDRFDWLTQVAEGLDALHQHGAILDGLRPDIIVISAEGKASITDLQGLLPLPLPCPCPIRASCYTAPELVLSPEKTDARADLYSFGAMIYALHLGRELTEMDFELQGVPKSILRRFPEIHPDLGRLIAKTFCRDPDARFPTQEAASEDPTGFKELTMILDHCRSFFEELNLDVAAWTTTGMVRSGNEDAFAIFHSAAAFEGRFHNSALVLVADGMGGHEAGEVAARIALEAVKDYLAKQPPFADLIAPGSRPPKDESEKGIDLEVAKQAIAAALMEANRQVYAASTSSAGRPGMGCTAEVLFTNGRNVLVGHVGDSRTYRFHRGELVLVTRDQTWVNRMVDIGAMSEQDAVDHPRQSELSQAIGGHHDVEPALYQYAIQPGDWILVCSDGLSNHVPPEAIKEILLAAGSAEAAARRLVNFANLQNAADNATVVVLHAN